MFGVLRYLCPRLHSNRTTNGTWYHSIIRNINPKAASIARNSVAISIPEILLRYTEVDIAVMGEGDVTIVELLRALINGLSIINISGICFLEDDCFHQT